MTHEQAQYRIAAILAELESDSGQVVRNIRIQDIDITRVNDFVPQWQREVCIKLEPIPGSHWTLA